MKESKFQSDLIKELKEVLKPCVILKNDPNYIQGFPDLLILKDDKWAALECKRNSNSHIQPNQKYYVDNLNFMSYAAFIFPENREEVIHELQRTFGVRR